MISEKQQAILAFPHSDYQTLICDGSVRSGKTSIMSVAYIDWAMRNFNHCKFIVLGRTVASAVRNVIEPYTMLGYARKRYGIKLKRGENRMVVSRGGIENYFDVFGAKDESSYTLIQGFTAAGCFVDEAALCVQSAVNQALARCSVEGARYWFSCNPEGPDHWFKTDWIDRAAEHNALYLHFELTDNPSLSAETVKRYMSQYTGVFYDRYIRGMWVRAEGLIYPEFEDSFGEVPEGKATDCAISCDYGTQNAFAAIKWEKHGSAWCAVDEYYYSGRDEKHQKTDDEYLADMLSFAEGMPEDVEFIVDPSAASFIAALRKSGRFRVRKARNDVIDGIRETASCMKQKAIVFTDRCKNLRKELGGYVWDEKADEDKPVKVADHCLTGDTLVETDNGPVPIEQLIGTEGLVWSVENGVAVLKRFGDVRMTRENAEIYEIETSDGRVIKCTGDHPVLTERGWVACIYLTCSDKIITI